MQINVGRYSYLAVLALAGALSFPVVAQQYPGSQQRQHDQDDQNRSDRNGQYDQNRQFYNTKAYQKGMKDGQHDREKNKGERADKKHWKNDRDRQAYQAGYFDGYRGTQSRNDRDRDDQRRDH